MKKQLIFVAALGLATTLMACSSQPTYPELKDFGGEKVADFSLGESQEIYASDGWSNGQPFNAVWTKDNVTYSNGQMHLGIKQKEAKDGDKTYPYTAGEARSHHLYGYGDYQVRMKPTAVVGSVSTFFVYTGQWDHIDGVANKHDEIDIEFLGKDTTKVQFNYFVNGKGGHEHMYDLGFDASKEFHDYGFRWEQDTISWVVDGKIVYQVKKDFMNPELPSTPGHIMTNYWPSSASLWSGTFNGATSDTVDYEWIETSATGIYSDEEKPAEPVEPVDKDFDWSKVTETDLTFNTGRADLYTLNKEEGVTTVTYNEAKDWANVTADIDKVALKADTINLTLKNNSSEKSTIRVDIQGSKKVGNTDCLNVSATAKGHSEIYTDTEWGGSKIELAASEEVEFVISYDRGTEKGLPTKLLIFIDSMQSEALAHEGGSVSISKIKFAKLGEGEDPAEPQQPNNPDNPGEEVKDEFDWSKVDSTALDFSTERGDLYSVTKGEDEKTTVTYSAAKDWANVSANISDFAGSFDTVNITLKNNSEIKSTVRVDIQGSIRVGNTDCLNVSATAKGHSEIYTDTEWGGSKIELAAGEEVEFVITYDTTTEKGAPKYLLIFMDSMQGEALAHEGGSITISNVRFAKLAKDEEGENEEEEKEYLAVSFNNDSSYVLSPSNEATKSVTVSYTDVKGNSYQSFGFGLDFVTEKETKFACTIKNNGEEAANIRVDILGKTQVGETRAINVSAEAKGHNEVYTDTTYGGSTITVAKDEEVVFTVTFDQTTDRGIADYLNFFIDSAKYDDEANHSGNVTLSNFFFE